MRAKTLITLTIAGLLVPAVVCQARTDNTVTFDNQSGQAALVKLIGPTQREVEVPVGQKRTVTASSGQYHIKTRYGTPGKYRYTKGDDFIIKDSASSRSKITITLHKVVDGNYDTDPISSDDFGDAPAQKQPVQKDALRPSQSTTSSLPGKILGEILAVPVDNTYSMSFQQGVPPIEWPPSEGKQHLLVCARVAVAGPKELSEFQIKADGDKTWTPFGVPFSLYDGLAGIPGVDGRTYFHRTDRIATGPNARITLLFAFPKNLPDKLTLHFRADTASVRVVSMAKWKELRAEQPPERDK